jgi:UDP-3-O-[3-hydroxymyristoyl] glucosamine N-acyltransferase
MRVRELAHHLNATFEGDGEKEIKGVAAVDAAGSTDLAFASGARAAPQAGASAAGCLIVPLDFDNAAARTILRAAEPRTTFARAVPLLKPEPKPSAGVHPTAFIAERAEVAASASIGPFVAVAEGARIGDSAIVGAGCSIGARVTIGEGARLHANVTIYHDVDIGARVILHSGCVIGADGFGFALAAGKYEKFPQVGRVFIGDDVEIGANSCVDRAALGVTWIGEGTKLDNMVHVGHNCRIGRHVVVAAQTGFSGGVVVEDHAVIGGQVGVGDKARIQSGAVLGSGSGVLTSKVVRGGQVLWGTPAQPLREHLEQLANLRRLPALRATLEELKKRIEALEGR